MAQACNRDFSEWFLTGTAELGRLDSATTTSPASLFRNRNAERWLWHYQRRDAAVDWWDFPVRIPTDLRGQRLRSKITNDSDDGTPEPPYAAIAIAPRYQKLL